MAQENEKELQQLRNRFRELADRSYNQGIYLFSPFLGLSEQDIFRSMEQELAYAGCTCYGGYDHADRIMIRFGEERQLGYEVPFPIVCLCIEPLMAKFAEQLSHRDFLGALMNLGIERGTIGDIKVGEKKAYLFCQDAMAEFICQNLTQVRHTHVKLRIVTEDQDWLEEKPQDITIQVLSMRLDAVIAKVYGISREKSLELFRSGKVFLNGRMTESNAKTVTVGDVVNVRGSGKFLVDGEIGQTKKGKLSVRMLLYR